MVDSTQLRQLHGCRNFGNLGRGIVCNTIPQFDCVSDRKYAKHANNEVQFEERKGAYDWVVET